MKNHFYVVFWFLTVNILFTNSDQWKMRRIFQGKAIGYYKILMTLGSCKDTLIFSEQKVWGIVRANRVLDIYYQSQNEYFKVSRVDINLVITDSDVMAYSKEGVGQASFAATVFMPISSLVVFYSLKIFTCETPIVKDTPSDNITDDEDVFNK